jgi:hypothetical protein
VNLTAQHLMPRSRMVELYIHPPPRILTEHRVSNWAEGQLLPYIHLLNILHLHGNIRHFKYTTFIKNDLEIETQYE